MRHLRARARTHPLVSRAQGILEERYRLPDERAAFALLEASSQRFNVRLRTLASAVVTVPRPRSPLPRPRMVPPPRTPGPPALAFQPGLRAATANTSEVLSAVLRRSMEITDATMGNVQLVDPVTGDLRLEKHHGLDDDFVDFFDRVSHEGTACALAAEHLARVTVTDVATDAAFTESARKAILATGSRGCHSTPLLAPRGRVEGMVSTHHERPPSTPCPPPRPAPSTRSATRPADGWSGTSAPSSSTPWNTSTSREARGADARPRNRTCRMAPPPTALSGPSTASHLSAPEKPPMTKKAPITTKPAPTTRRFPGGARGA
ncbi:ANTAR domain-containing protein [Streptomyces albus]